MGASILVAVLFAQAFRRCASDPTFQFQPGGDEINYRTTDGGYDHILKIKGDDNAQWYATRPGENCVRVIDREGQNNFILAGDCASAGFRDAAFGGEALFNHPRGLCQDWEGNTFVLDSGNRAVRWIDSTGAVGTVAALDAIWDGELSNPGRLHFIDCGKDSKLRISEKPGSTPLWIAVPTNASSSAPRVGRTERLCFDGRLVVLALCLPTALCWLLGFWVGRRSGRHLSHLHQVKGSDVGPLCYPPTNEPATLLQELRRRADERERERERERGGAPPTTLGARDVSLVTTPGLTSETVRNRPSRRLEGNEHTGPTNPTRPLGTVGDTVYNRSDANIKQKTGKSAVEIDDLAPPVSEFKAATDNKSLYEDLAHAVDENAPSGNATTKGGVD